MWGAQCSTLLPLRKFLRSSIKLDSSGGLLKMAGGLRHKNSHKLPMTSVQSNLESNAEGSFEVTQVFCRLILQASLIAIPAYLGLFMIAVPFDVDAGVERGLILATPVVEFVVAAIIYSIGFLITIPDGNRENLDNGSRMRSRIIHRKMRLILLGSVLLLLGILSGTLLLLKAHL